MYSPKRRRPETFATDREPGIILTSSNGIVKTNKKNDQRRALGILSDTRTAYLPSLGRAEPVRLIFESLLFGTLLRVLTFTKNLHFRE
jgi:hypothetical protein